MLSRTIISFNILIMYLLTQYSIKTNCASWYIVELTEKKLLKNKVRWYSSYVVISLKWKLLRYETAVVTKYVYPFTVTFNIQGVHKLHYLNITLFHRHHVIEIKLSGPWPKLVIRKFILPKFVRVTAAFLNMAHQCYNSHSNKNII